MKYPVLSLISKPQAVEGEKLPRSDEVVRAALARVVTSKHFSKAHRCSSLLTYLVERVLDCSDTTASPPEHEIGVAVFGRDPDAYFPGDDPIVRVQAGRLRLRLAAYYANEGAAERLRITVPQGGYRARLALADHQPARPLAASAPILMFSPLVCLSPGACAAHFTAGLNDELGYRLYRDLGPVSLAGRAGQAHESGGTRARHVLEGTVRQDAARLRVSLQLRDGEEGLVLWYAQFDSADDGSIAIQEQMAERCVQALQVQMPVL